MRSLLISLLLAVVVAAGACSRTPDVGSMKPGTSVTITMKDGSILAGRLVEAKADQVIIDPFTGGEWKTIARNDIASLKQTDAGNTQPASASAPAEAPAPPAAAQPTVAPPAAEGSRIAASPARPKTRPSSEAPPAPSAGATGTAGAPPAAAPTLREVVIPSGTILHVKLNNGIASDKSRREDPISGTLAKAVIVDGVDAIPAGAMLKGIVTEAKPSEKVKGRAQLGYAFNSVDVDNELYRIRTQPAALEAASTTKKDAMKIGIPAAGGAILGAIIGGGKGAAIGGVVGSGAGAAVVLSTPGEELRLPAGTAVTVKLLEPVTVRVPLR